MIKDWPRAGPEPSSRSSAAGAIALLVALGCFRKPLHRGLQVGMHGQALLLEVGDERRLIRSQPAAAANALAQPANLGLGDRLVGDDLDALVLEAGGRALFGRLLLVGPPHRVEARAHHSGEKRVGR